MRIAATIGFCCLSASAWAQPSSPPQNDPLVGTVALGYLATSGNTSTSNTNGTFKATWDPGRTWTHTWTAFLIRARAAGNTVADSESAGYMAQRDYGKGFIFGAADWRQDAFSGYDRQSVEVVGYGRKLIDSDRQLLSWQGGIGRRQASVVDNTSFNDTIIRGGLDYTYYLSENSQFVQRLLLEHGSNNQYFESLSSIKGTLRGNLSLALSYIIKHNSDVPFPSIIDKTDRFTAVTVQYGF
jgi:putative salt-induced outer membrane protein